MHSLTPAPPHLHFVLSPTPMYPFFPSSPTPCRPFSTAQPRRRALSAYFVPFSDSFFAKSKIYSHQPKMYPREQACRLAHTDKLRRRASRVYLVSFSDFFFRKKQKREPPTKNVRCIYIFSSEGAIMRPSLF